MHWPYGAPITVFGAIGMATFYSIQFYQKQSKILLDYSKLLLLISILFHYVFLVLHLEYGHVFKLVIRAVIIVFLVLYVREKLFPSQVTISKDLLATTSRRKKISYLLYGFATTSIVIGALFKFLHWQFGFLDGTVLLSLGLLTAIISLYLGPIDADS